MRRSTLMSSSGHGDRMHVKPSPLRLTAKLQSRVSETGDEDPFTDVEEAEDELEESETVLNAC